MLFSTLLIATATVHGLASGASLPQRHSRQEPGSEPTCSGKEQGSTFTYTPSSGSPFDIICGQDYAGGDLKALTTSSFKDCLTACNTERTCVTVAYRDGACYLKNQVTSAVPNEGVWSAKKEVVPTNTALSCEDNRSDGITYTASKGRFRIICGKEYPGGDLTSTSTSTFEDCIETCATNARCIDVSYVNGACYLKQTLTTLSEVGYAWTAQLIDAQPSLPSPSATPTGPAPLSCLDNADNGKSYTTESGKIFTVECGVDHAGGDLAAVDSTTFETCMDACAVRDGCIDVSWVYGSCYLKSTLNEGVILSHVWTGRLTTSQSSPAVSMASAQTSSSASPTLDLSSSISLPLSTSITSTSSLSIVSFTTASSSPSSTPSPSGASTTSLLSTSTFVSATTNTPTSLEISAQTPSATSSGPPSFSTAFCLKVVTPGLPITGEYLTSFSINSNFVLGYNYPTLFFKLEQSGRLLMDTGNVVAPPSYTDRSFNQPRQFAPEVVAANPSNYPPFMCSITAKQTLECKVTGTLYTNKYWISCTDNQAKTCVQIASDMSLQKTYFELGVVPKEQCPAIGP
ncbi:hypothetical protein E8E11_006828 [Didymella keratinophila]|nr:hypothetical protein E8E11_006828 [Didymella keratinophila]